MSCVLPLVPTMNVVDSPENSGTTGLSQRQKATLLGYIAYGLLLQLLAAFHSLGEAPDVLGAVFGAPASVIPAPSAIFMWSLIGYLIATGRYGIASRVLITHYWTIPVALAVQIGFWGRGRAVSWIAESNVEMWWVALLMVPYIVGQFLTWRLLRAGTSR